MLSNNWNCADKWFRRLSINWNCPDNWFRGLSTDWNCLNLCFRVLSMNLKCLGNCFLIVPINWNCPDNWFRNRSINWHCPDNGVSEGFTFWKLGAIHRATIDSVSRLQYRANITSILGSGRVQVNCKIYHMQGAYDSYCVRSIYNRIIDSIGCVYKYTT